MYRILGMKIKNHHYLKDFELNFTKANGDAFSKIIFAGENGCGKTQILSIIKEFIALFRFGISSTSGPTISCDMEFQIRFDNETYLCKLTRKPDVNSIEMRSEDEAGNIVNNVKHQLKAISSRTEINFTPGRVDSIKNSDIDSIGGQPIFETERDIATTIKQLILDIETRDNSDHVTWERENPGKGVPPENFLKNKRMSRFNRAFSFMFNDKLKFSKIKGTDVLFEKNGNKFSIDDLSSGEKQIVFRGGNLIQNLNIFSGCTVLIDEPELSIHPKWQEKLLGFYENLFSVGANKAQIFIATHSDHILKSALEDDDSIIVKIKTSEKNEVAGEKIYKKGQGKILPRVTIGEVKWSVFDLPTIDFHCALFGHLQGVEIKNSYGNTILLPTDARGNPRPRSIYELDEVLKSLGAPTVPSGLKNTHRYAQGHIGDKTLCAYLRNQIDHPESSEREPEIYTQNLQASIEFMISLAMYSR